MYVSILIIFSYIICEGANESKKIVIEYLHSINNDLNQHFRDDNSNTDVTHIVPLSILKNDENFFNYIMNSNEK